MGEEDSDNDKANGYHPSAKSVAAPTSSQLIDVTDVNYLDDEDNNSDYDSEVGGEDFDVDSAPVVSSDTRADEGESSGEDEHISTDFLDHLGGAVRLANGLLNQSALRATRWSPVNTEFENDKASTRTCARARVVQQLRLLRSSSLISTFSCAFVLASCGTKLQLRPTDTSGSNTTHGRPRRSLPGGGDKASSESQWP